MYEPYRSFYLFLELLHMKEETNNNKITKIKTHLYKTQFPDANNSPLKISLAKLERCGVITYSTNISDFDVEIIGDLGTLLDRVDRDPYENPKEVFEYFERSLDEIYSSSTDIINVFYAFFDSKYYTEYNPKNRKIKIIHDGKDDKIEDEESVNTEKELNEIEFETSIGRQLAKVFH